jgi:putative transposase
VNAADPEEPAHKRKFTVRRDPRDISVIHFWDPEAQEYFRIREWSKYSNGVRIRNLR